GLSNGHQGRWTLSHDVRVLLERRQTHGAWLRGEQGWADLDQARGQPCLPPRAKTRVGVKLYHEPYAAASARRHLSALVCRAQRAAVDQPVLRHRHGPVERAWEAIGLTAGGQHSLPVADERCPGSSARDTAGRCRRLVTRRLPLVYPLAVQ